MSYEVKDNTIVPVDGYSRYGIDKTGRTYVMKNGQTFRHIASVFSVSETTIRRVIHGETYKAEMKNVV